MRNLSILAIIAATATAAPALAEFDINDREQNGTYSAFDLGDRADQEIAQFDLGDRAEQEIAQVDLGDRADQEIAQVDLGDRAEQEIAQVDLGDRTESTFS